MVERGGELRAGRVQNVTSKTLQDIIRENVTSDSRIVTDNFLAYNGLDKEFSSHETVDHGIHEYVRGDIYTNTLKGWFSLLKRGVNGTFHHVSEQHLDRYVGKFQFRYNNRKVDDGERARNAIKGAEGLAVEIGQFEVRRGGVEGNSSHGRSSKKNLTQRVQSNTKEIH